MKGVGRIQPPGKGPHPPAPEPMTVLYSMAKGSWDGSSAYPKLRRQSWPVVISSQWDPFWTSEVQSCKIVNVCCVQPLALWSLPTATTENSYKDYDKMPKEKCILFPWKTKWIISHLHCSLNSTPELAPSAVISTFFVEFPTANA